MLLPNPKVNLPTIWNMTLCILTHSTYVLFLLRHWSSRQQWSISWSTTVQDRHLGYHKLALQKHQSQGVHLKQRVQNHAWLFRTNDYYFYNKQACGSHCKRCCKWRAVLCQRTETVRSCFEVSRQRSKSLHF